jgi:hypothetical protein
MKTTEIIEMLNLHGIYNYTTENGRVLALGAIDLTKQSEDQYDDLTDMDKAQLLDWMGYDQEHIDYYHL